MNQLRIHQMNQKYFHPPIIVISKRMSYLCIIRFRLTTREGDERHAGSKPILWNCNIYMYVSENNPPHFHVWYDDYKAIITIADGIITGSLPRRALNMVYDWLDLHKEELTKNWERLQAFEAPEKIAPLK